MEVDTSAVELAASLNIRKEKRKFNSKLYGRTIQKGFAKLYKDESLSDLTLLVGDEKIPVHKMVSTSTVMPFILKTCFIRFSAHGRKPSVLCLKPVLHGQKVHKRNLRYGRIVPNVLSIYSRYAFTHFFQ